MALDEATHDKKMRGFLFFVAFSTNLLINVDHGILPATTNELRKDLNIDNASLGLLGSLVYLGLVIGKLLKIIHNNKYIINKLFS